MKKPQSTKMSAGKVDAEKDAAAIMGRARTFKGTIHSSLFSSNWRLGKVEVMLKLTHAQAEQLARLLAERKLG